MIPYIYHPTQVILVDDDLNFLSLLASTLKSNNFTFKKFSRPEEAVDFINGNEHPTLSASQYIRDEDNLSFESNSISLDYSKIPNNAQHPDRTKTISIIIADYHMPGMNGLELLSKIKNKNIKTILLTGEADDTLGVHAFNKGLINQFVKKQSRNLDNLLQEMLKELSYEFFLEMSSQLHQITKKCKNLPIATDSRKFAEFFKNIIKDKDIKEYYLFEPVGSYLLIDHQGSHYTLFTQNEDQAESFCIEIEPCDDKTFSNSLKNEARERKKIFCYHIADKEDLLPAEEWANYYNECTQIAGENTFYSAMISGSIGQAQT